MSKELDETKKMFSGLINKVKGLFSKKEEKQRIDVDKLKENITVNNKKEEKKAVKLAPKKPKVKTKADIKKKEEINKELKEKYARYWMLIGTPDKWYGDKNKKNAGVNSYLKNLEKGEWEISKALSKNISVGEQGLIKLSQDTRSKERRMFRNKEQDKLDQGIYAFIKFGEVVEDNDIYKIKFEVIHNLFKEDKLIGKEASEKIVGKISRTKEIDTGVYKRALEEGTK